MGGLDKQQELKNQYREQAGLPPLPEDPGEVCRHMRASSPPASAADLIEQQIPHRGLRPGNKRVIIRCTLILHDFFFLSNISYRDRRDFQVFIKSISSDVFIQTDSILYFWQRNKLHLIVKGTFIFVWLADFDKISMYIGNVMFLISHV